MKKAPAGWPGLLCLSGLDLRLSGEADFLQPGHRDRAGQVLVGELPAMQTLFAGVPRKVRPAIVHQGREADAALVALEQNDAQLAQLAQGVLEADVGLRNF